MDLSGYTASSRPLSNAELRELKEGAQNLRAWARRNQHEDPDGAASRIRSAAQNEADITAELNRRRKTR